MIFMRCFAAVIMAVQPGLGIWLLGCRVVDGVKNLYKGPYKLDIWGVNSCKVELIALFMLTAGLTTPWPNCNFCGWGGVGWGGVGMMTFFELQHMVDATQLCLSCNCTHGGCYATVLVL